MSKHRARSAQIENDLHHQRSQRQRIFQRARLEEVALPVLPADAEPVAPEAGAATGGPKRKRGAKGRGSAAGSSSAVLELLASESFSPTGLVGTGTLEGESTAEPAAAEAEEEAVRIDFSSLRAGGENVPETEAATAEELARVSAEIEGLTPNMKALQQFEEVQDRMHAMEGEWEGSRTAARSVSQRFTAVQAQRHERFMAAFTHVSTVIDDIYKELTQVRGIALCCTSIRTRNRTRSRLPVAVDAGGLPLGGIASPPFGRFAKASAPRPAHHMYF
jgi:structural maintenance of chromosome 1